MNSVIWALVLSTALLSCKQKLEYNPTLPLQGNYVIYEEFISSSKIAEVKQESEKEKTGTAFEIHTNVSIKPHEGGTRITWEPKQFLSNGWNKNLLPRIHQKKLNLNVELDTDGNLLAIHGYRKLPAVLKAVQNDKVFTRRLLSRMDTSLYKDNWWDRWVLSTFLPPGVYEAGQLIEVEAVNKRLKRIKADSILIRGERNSRNHPCLEYSVHYTSIDSFNIEMEEFVVVHKKNLVSNSSNAAVSNLQIRTHNFMTTHDPYGQIARPGLVDSVTVKGSWRFSLSMSTGLPCYEFKKEDAPVVLVDSISNRIHVNFYRTTENGFKTF